MVDETIQDYLSTLKIERKFFEGKNILDCGFGGTGWGVELFCNSNANSVHGIDLNEKWISRVGERLKNSPISPKLVCGSVLHLPYPDNQFDYVHSHGVMHHTTDWKKGVEEMIRVCKPGGTIYLMLYGKFAPLGNFIRITYRFLGKIIPYSWAKKFVDTTGIFQNHEVSLLDAMYVPIEEHLSQDEIREALESQNMKNIRYFESEKWKKKKFFSSNFMFGKNIQNVVLAQKSE